MALLLRYTKIFLFFLGLAGCLWVSADLPGLQEIFDGNKYYDYS